VGCYVHLNRTRCHSIAGAWLAAAALALRKRLLQNAFRRPRGDGQQFCLSPLRSAVETPSELRVLG
jgi:hypothetical protein